MNKRFNEATGVWEIYDVCCGKYVPLSTQSTYGLYERFIEEEKLKMYIKEKESKIFSVFDWGKEFTGRFYNTKSIPEITKVVYDIPNGTTITYFADDTKEIARVQRGEGFDKEQGVMACVAKKMYGSRSAWKKIVDNGVEVKPKKIKTKKVEIQKWGGRTYLDRFLKGEKIAIECDSEQDVRKLFHILSLNGVKWGSGCDLGDIEDYAYYSTKSFSYKFKYCDGDVSEGLGHSDNSFYEEEGYEIIKFKDIYNK